MDLLHYMYMYYVKIKGFVEIHNNSLLLKINKYNSLWCIEYQISKFHNTNKFSYMGAIHFYLYEFYFWLDSNCISISISDYVRLLTYANATLSL